MQLSNKTLMYIIILTIVGSVLAYKIVVKAYDSVYIGADYTEIR